MILAKEIGIYHLVFLVYFSYSSLPSLSLILSEYVLIVRGIQYHERGKKYWLVLFFLLSSNRFHQPLVYKCLRLYAPLGLCPLFLVYLNCTVIHSVLKVLFSLLSRLALSPFLCLDPNSFRVYLNERWQLFIYQLFPLKKQKQEYFVHYFNPPVVDTTVLQYLNNREGSQHTLSRISFNIALLHSHRDGAMTPQSLLKSKGQWHL